VERDGLAVDADGELSHVAVGLLAVACRLDGDPVGVVEPV